MITTVLFDLDGTLLPIDQDSFIKEYFEYLTMHMARYGYNPKRFYKTIYNGSVNMLTNNSGKTNEAVFWECFSQEFGQDALNDKPYFDEFYKISFIKLKKHCGFNPDARKIVYMLKDAGMRVILATNPIFPAVATESRIRWAGLDPTDFEFYTTYENSYHCKPSRAYYEDVLKDAGVNAGECIMVGNDVGDDMPARDMGMKVFLLTDCLINTRNADISQYPNGGFKKLEEYLKNNI